MKLLVPIVVTLISTTTPLLATAELPRVTFLAVSDAEPALEEVVNIFVDHLLEVDIEVEVVQHELAAAPKGPVGWLKHALAMSAAPGTVAAFGYFCGKKKCTLHIVDPRQGSYSKLPVLVPPGDKRSRALAIAATAREALLGPLFPEMKRLVNEGRNPSEPLGDSDNSWLRSPVQKERKPARTEKRRLWLWLEGGYVGDLPHPQGHPVHGPWTGLRAEPVELVGTVLTIGWLGMRRAEEEAANVQIHRLTLSLSIPLILPLGPAHISLAPTARLDIAFADIDNVDHPDDKRTYLEFQAGGVTNWYLPLSNNLDIIIGAGILVSVLSEEIEVTISGNQQVTAVPSSAIRMTWNMGLAWSPMAKPSSKRKHRR